ncbi:MAG: DUF2782 domain-containing protein [Halothiobacillaceae bacterium]
MHKIHFSTALLLAAALPAAASDALPPPLEPSAQTEAVPEPEITIRTSNEGVIEEYRIKGRLYMIKISPKDAPPYYLIDSDGDGELETRHNGPMEARLIPQWILFRW